MIEQIEQLTEKYKYSELIDLERELNKEEAEALELIKIQMREEGDRKHREYLKKVHSTPSIKEYKINELEFLVKVKSKFFKLYGKVYEDDQNLKNIIKYFAGSEEFLNECEPLNEPSFEKGLLIIGSYGCGKTSTMRSIRECLVHTPLSFRYESAIKVVEDYEGCSEASEKISFWKKQKSGKAYYDDVKAEDQASNYGKKEIFKDIIQKRYNDKKKTYITCNFKEGYQDDIKMALQEFGERYGGRIHDRIFEMFNIYWYKGKSKRK